MSKTGGMRQRGCLACGGTGVITTRSPEWVRQRREAAGLTLREVARRLGLSAPYISDLELGRRPMAEKLWQRYAKALAGRYAGATP